MPNKSDAQLLREYAASGAESAFGEIVSRHTNLIYSAALRQSGAPDTAREITQSVFTDLARKARTLAKELSADASLAGWLYRGTRYAALNSRREERRRQAREKIVMEHFNLAPGTEDDWARVAPVLDEAMNELGEADREAVLLRYFQNQDFQAVGRALGVSDDTAQKRVSRAVDRLRDLLTKRGVAVGGGGLVILISANAVLVAPAGLSAAIVASALAGTTLITTVTATVGKVIAMTTMQKILVITVLAAAGTGIFEAREASILRARVQTLQQQQAPLVEQIQQLQREREDTANRLASLGAEIAGMKSDSTELQKLRGEVTQLRDGIRQANDPFIQTALAWKAKEAKLRKLFEDRPGQRIPEMQFLADREWLDIARDSDLDSEDGISTAMSSARTKAKHLFVPVFQKALNKYAEANNGSLPDDLSLLRPYFNPPVDDALLQRYEPLDKTSPEWSPGMVVIEKTVIDASREGRTEIGLHSSRVGSPLIKPIVWNFPRELESAYQLYKSKNNGLTPNDWAELMPYLTTPEEKAALEKFLLLTKH